ncbi:MAG: hypothetical protein AABX65_04315, partial [Nanoarchaeota archaeon]
IVYNLIFKRRLKMNPAKDNYSEYTQAEALHEGSENFFRKRELEKSEELEILGIYPANQNKLTHRLNQKLTLKRNSPEIPSFSSNGQQYILHKEERNGKTEGFYAISAREIIPLGKTRQEVAQSLAKLLQETDLQSQ